VTRFTTLCSNWSDLYGFYPATVVKIVITKKKGKK
jgi:hypothetical protein